MKKIVRFDSKAQKELYKLDILVQREFTGLIIKLEKDGKLNFPEAKKIDNNLFEIRVKLGGAYRGFYGYMEGDYIVILHFFHKKSQKTPSKNLKLTLRRLKQYE